MIRATFAGFNTALSALQANQKRLDISGQNLANMNTVGYTRQNLETSSLNYTNPISRYMNGSEIVVGYGVAMDKVTQIRDPFLDAQYRSQMEKSSYTDSLQVSLDSLSRVLDESSIAGIRQAFDNIQNSLNSAQDPAKINDPVFESELRTRMENLANLLNRSAQKIDEARKQEYERLNGEGTNQNGAEQTVNDILKQIGELNRQIKHNQIFGQQSLELMDERNVLLDKLASYVPIEIRYKKDDLHKDDKDWPDDLYVDLVYYKDGKTRETLTLISGTEGGASQNYGSLKFDPEPDQAAADNYLNVTAKFTSAAVADNGTKGDVTISGSSDPDAENEFTGGSIQASLDMLSGEVTQDAKVIEQTDVHGYQYYMNHLDNLASSFATVMNEINKLGNKGNDAPLLVDRIASAGGTTTTTGITAANIGINVEWANGTVSLGKGIEDHGNNANDTALAMLRAMNVSYSAQDTVHPYYGVNLGNKTFAGYISNVSTVLASDSSNNQDALKNNVTVLNGIQNSRDSVSGISLDEEASNMMTYLAAYNAASRLMTTLDEALNTLINNTGLVGR
ncbi:MAG: flagellar biosynthesis protein FlgK [Lachnospiraceae bacterium]|jgi:flagellar hook-associated protein 1 FlgK|nr:flagellar biosynthesis protein FlgK [Lachnospiraceae bacterium]